jgi:peptidyl-tRNA hydrolase
MTLVQTIVVKPSEHFDTVAAAALASGLAMADADLKSDPWHSWLSGSFTKSVRRAKRPAELARVRALDMPGTEISIGDAVAIAFAPQRYEDNAPAISKLQVSGLDLMLGGTDFHLPAEVTPHIEVNRDVYMSTGKAAAQVAHALGAWVLAQSDETRTAWARDPGLSICEVSFTDYQAHDSSDPSMVTIVDQGRTEIEPGTATARVFLN